MLILYNNFINFEKYKINVLLNVKTKNKCFIHNIEIQVYSNCIVHYY